MCKNCRLPPPPSPLTNPGYTTITDVAEGDTRANSPIPPLIGEFKKGGEEGGNWSMPLQNLPLIMAKKKKNAVLIHTFSKISLPCMEGDSPLPHPPPLGNFAPSLCPPPPVNKSWLHHCHWRSYNGVQAPRPPIDWRD